MQIGDDAVYARFLEPYEKVKEKYNAAEALILQAFATKEVPWHQHVDRRGPAAPMMRITRLGENSEERTVNNSEFFHWK